MTVYSVRHITHYSYKRPVAFGQHRVLFRPRDSFDQRLLDATMTIDPEPAEIRWIHDVFGNCIALVDIDRPADQLRFETNIRLDHTPQVPLDLEIDRKALTYPFSYDDEEMTDLSCTITRHYEDPGGAVAHWAHQFVGTSSSGQTGHVLMTLCYAIHESFVYARRSEHGTQAPIQTLMLRQGTCRDFALLMMEAARSLGLAARFVTGYIYVPDRDGSTTLGGGSTHAWCQVYLPGAGWVEFDPTNGIVGNHDLIRVGVARDPRQAVPLWGSYDGAADDFDDLVVQVNVTTEQ
ncbi:transglutaminase family protein [Rhizobium mongolense]|uniref:Transglutaminase-like putative cysteine protease n=2 Tax=Rhizobium mongolense TaxID=57676 RepID=A0A7W6RI42_9HYPH|nr:transglutaminase family protein [Rhizobium mongolense]MBB4232235.1 transglutaminase-like putative cysteine protease [Rhizobium mongolense]MBB4272358.1 transglutaminase-like putative cysteine protease [Rhizobium mongolense]TVZ63047.1 transglutaminase-like putative cysteine protease [Rhizobium mongolense USDA 1844]